MRIQVDEAPEGQQSSISDGRDVTAQLRDLAITALCLTMLISLAVIVYYWVQAVRAIINRERVKAVAGPLRGD